MLKAAIIILADTEGAEGLGRVLNALEAAKELKESGDEVRILFDGAGTKWIAPLSNPEHMLHGVFEATRDRVAAACSYCANAYQVADEVAACGIDLAADFDDHHSVRALLAQGYQVLTY